MAQVDACVAKAYAGKCGRQAARMLSQHFGSEKQVAMSYSIWRLASLSSLFLAMRGR